MDEKIEYSRKIDVKYKADVAIFGGGIAGFSAACAAAKSGASVLLVEKFGCVGGNATVGGVAAFCGHTKGQGEVFDEIVTELEKYNAIDDYSPDFNVARVFDHEILAVILLSMLEKRGVKLLLHTKFIDCVKENNLIKYAIISGKSGVEAVLAKCFIDATGEGEVAFSAGCEFMKGRTGDGLTLPMSMMYFVRHVEKKDVKMLPNCRHNEIKTEKDLPMTSIWRNGARSNAIKIKIPKFDATDTESLTNAEIFARKRMMQVLSYHQKKEERPWILDHCSPQIGIREGRRIVGDYILTVDDVRAGREFEDAVAVGTFYLDGHKPDDDKRTYILTEKEMKVPPYQIPYRSILAKNIDNLFVVGRCFSADQLALSSARVMTTASMLGQAAGISAAVCTKNNETPRKIDIKEVQRIITERKGELSLPIQTK